MEKALVVHLEDNREYLRAVQRWIKGSNLPVEILEAENGTRLKEVLKGLPDGRRPCAFIVDGVPLEHADYESHNALSSAQFARDQVADPGVPILILSGRDYEPDEEEGILALPKTATREKVLANLGILLVLAKTERKIMPVTEEPQNTAPVEMGGLSFIESNGILRPEDPATIIPHTDWLEEHLDRALLGERVLLAPINDHPSWRTATNGSEGKLPVPRFGWHCDGFAEPILALANPAAVNRRGPTLWIPFRKVVKIFKRSPIVEGMLDHSRRDLDGQRRNWLLSISNTLRYSTYQMPAKDTVTINWSENPWSVMAVNNQAGMHTGLRNNYTGDLYRRALNAR